MSNAVFRPLLPSSRCKHIYLVVSPAFLSCFPPRWPTLRAPLRHRPRLARPRRAITTATMAWPRAVYADPGIRPLDQSKKSQPRLAAWEIQPQAFASALLHASPRLGPRTYLVYIGAFDARAPQDDKGKVGDQSPWEVDRSLAHADAESLGDEGLYFVYYEEQKEQTLQRIRPDEQQRDADARQDQPGRAHW